MAFLSFRNVDCTRQGRRVLESLSFDLNTNETLVLLGRSGSGKTTIVRLILRLLEPAAGEIVLEGANLQTSSVIDLRRRIGYVIQEIGLLPHWTVTQNVALVPNLLQWPKDKINKRVSELLDQVGLPASEFASRMPAQLSGGQRQRVGVARALAGNPALLLFDEPFGALDPLTRLEMQRQFVSLRDHYRTPAIFITHDVSEALRLGTRIGVLDNGRLETVLPASEFSEAQTPLARAFLNTLQPAEDFR